MQVCGAEECEGKLSRACMKQLGCGHWCGGVAGEAVCLPCLQVSMTNLSIKSFNKAKWSFCPCQSGIVVKSEVMMEICQLMALAFDHGHLLMTKEIQNKPIQSMHEACGLWPMVQLEKQLSTLLRFRVRV